MEKPGLSSLLQHALKECSMCTYLNIVLSQTKFKCLVKAKKMRASAHSVIFTGTRPHCLSATPTMRERHVLHVSGADGRGYTLKRDLHCSESPVSVSTARSTLPVLAGNAEICQIHCRRDPLIIKHSNRKQKSVRLWKKIWIVSLVSQKVLLLIQRIVLQRRLDFLKV